MKKAIFSILLLYIISSSLKAQYSKANIEKADVEKAKVDIELLSTKWDKAVEQKDSLTLEKILAPNYSLYFTNIFAVPPFADHTFRNNGLITHCMVLLQIRYK